MVFYPVLLIADEAVVAKAKGAVTLPGSFMKNSAGWALAGHIAGMSLRLGGSTRRFS